MNVLAINGSPRAQNSGTGRILAALLEGMRDAGAGTDLIHVMKLHLEPCTGCYHCWVKTPGRCIHQDDMAEAIARYDRADVVVFGTPVYHCSMTGIMKTFLDRLLPRYEPWLIPHPSLPGLTGHPLRTRGPDRAFLVSTCGFPELDNFDALVTTFRQIARFHGMQYLGEVLRPFAEPLANPRLAQLFTPYFAEVRRAGRALVEQGEVPAEIAQALRRDLVAGGKERLYALANEHWERLQAARTVRPAPFEDQPQPPTARPNRGALP